MLEGEVNPKQNYRCDIFPEQSRSTISHFFTPNDTIDFFVSPRTTELGIRIFDVVDQIIQ